MLGLLRLASPPEGRSSKSAARHTVDFNDQVRPILSRHCFKCHGPDDKGRKAKLRLDIEEAAKKPASSGERPIVPGKPDDSELVRRIFAEDAEERMPPRAANSQLSDARAADSQTVGRRGGEVRRALGLPETGQARDSQACARPRLGAKPDRRVYPGPARARRIEAVSRRLIAPRCCGASRST